MTPSTDHQPTPPDIALPQGFAPEAGKPETLSGRSSPGSDPAVITPREPASVSPSSPAATRVTPPSTPGAGLRWLTYLLFDPLIILLTSFFGCISLLASLWDHSGRQQHAIARVWARALLAVTHSPVTVRGAEHLAGLTTAVYVCNHLSYMDTPVLFANLPFQFRIFAKQSLWRLPFIGWHLRRSGQVPVDQTTARNSVTSLNRGVATLRDGMPLVLFPEGGRSPSGLPRSFLPGAAYMALRAQVPLVPITLVGTYELLPMHVYALRPRPLELILGMPIPHHRPHHPRRRRTHATRLRRNHPHLPRRHSPARLNASRHPDLVL